MNLKQTQRIFGTALLLMLGCGKDFNTYLEQARQNFDEKNYINAVDKLNVGLLRWKDSDGNESKAEAYQILGQSYHSLRNTDKAAEAYREAIKLSTRTYPSAYSLGMIYLAKKQISPAIDAFQKALQLKNDDPMALLGLGNCYYELRRYKDAQFTFQRVLDVSPAVPEALEGLSLVRGRSNPNPKKAVPKPAAPAYKAPIKQPDRNAVLKKKKKR